MSNKQEIVPNVHESAKTGDARVIVVPKDVATGDFHNRIEMYIAKRRMQGISLTKPQAVVELASFALSRI